MTVSASAPVRLDFAGGWTDVAPFAEREHGVVVNAAIELRVVASVAPREAGYDLRAGDLEAACTVAALDALAGERRLGLLAAALRRARPGPCALATRSAVSPSSGLGSSGALGVALVAALDAAAGRARPAADLAEEAFQLEAVDAELPGGRQDQLAAALGGFLRIDFARGGAAAAPLALDAAFREELERRIVVCYTGSSRVSSDTIARVMSAYDRGDRVVTGALQALADVAAGMADALAAADLARTAALLDENWRRQQALDAGMCTPAMARLEAAMRAAGALGGKAAGAGAGGSMFFIAGSGRGGAEHAAREAGAAVLPFRWASAGVQVELASPAAAGARE